MIVDGDIPDADTVGTFDNSVSIGQKIMIKFTVKIVDQVHTKKDRDFIMDNFDSIFSLAHNRVV
jgi:hypothetical protein